MTTTTSRKVINLRHAQATYDEHASTFRAFSDEVGEHRPADPLLEAPYRDELVRCFTAMAAAAEDASDRASLYATSEELADGTYCQNPCRPHAHDVCMQIVAENQAALAKVERLNERVSA